ncbi:Non-specific lipid transfer protein GPI-anchored 25 [Hirschfeldia incana]|nr:Non-specific lipid transfer protein GPI-anchored 25 [Hirschfeldia incana]
MAATIVCIIILAITFSSSSAVAETTQPPSSSSQPAPTCSEELVMFSPCIPYVSAPPNNVSDTPEALCCSVFSSSVHSTAGNCLCYLLRDPMTLGFPLDRSRLLSLSQICSEFKSSDESFESLCSPSESPELPPLQSIQFTSPFDYGDRDSASSPQSLGLPPETAKIPPSSDQFSPDVDNVSPPPPQLIINGSLMISKLLLLTTTIIIMTLAISILTRI